MARSMRAVLAVVCLAASAAAGPAQAATRYDLVSTAGPPGARSPYDHAVAISGDGRYVAYLAGANYGILPADAEVAPPGSSDLYLADLKTGRQTKVMTGSCCVNSLSLSRDGRYLAFDSGTQGLVPGDTNQYTDVFVYDAKTKRLSRMLNVRGGQLENGAVAGVVTADGGTVVYVSRSDVFVKRNQQAPPCAVYKYSLKTRKTTAVTVGGAAVCSFPADIAASSDGRYLALVSMDRLVREDVSSQQDVYWVDTVLHRAVLASEPVMAGEDTTVTSAQPTIDGSGRLVGFITGGMSPYALQTDQKVMLRDIPSGRLLDVSTGLLGEGSNDTVNPKLSENGRWLTFTDNHGEAIGAYHYDLRGVYVRDLTKDVSTTTRLEPIGGCTAPSCLHPSSQNAVPSGDGRVIAYLTNSAWSPKDGDQLFDIYVARL